MPVCWYRDDVVLTEYVRLKHVPKGVFQDSAFAHNCRRSPAFASNRQQNSANCAMPNCR